MPATALDVSRIAELCNALADEARVEIIARLIDGEKCVCNLTDDLETGQSRLSYHLRVLKDAGLVTDRREGRWAYYSLAPDAFLEAEELLAAMRPKANSETNVKNGTKVAKGTKASNGGKANCC